MKTKIVKCGICENWHNHFHCPTCAAVRIYDRASHATEYRNALTGRLMVRHSATFITRDARTITEGTFLAMAQELSR